MADEWRTLSLIEAGVRLIDCEHRTPPAAETGYPYIAIPQLQSGRIDFSKARRITPEHFAEWTRKAKPQPYDVILSRRCNPGETAFVPPGVEFAVGQNLVLLRADGTKIYPPFLRWLVRGPEWWEQVSKFLNVGAVFDSLKCADIPNFRLRVPPLDEQRAIAHILGTLDDKIELNRKMNQTLEAIARAIFKSWFVDFDPVIDNALAAGKPIPEEFAERAARRARLTPEKSPLPENIRRLFPDEFQDSELGPIPKGWKVSAIGEEFNVTMGQSPPGRTYNETGDGLPFFQGRRDFGFRYPTKRVYCSEPKRIAEAGDALVTVRAPVGEVNMAWEKVCIGRGVAALRHRSGGRSFTYYAVLALQDQFKGYEAEGTVFGSITKQQLSDMKWLAPSQPILEGFELLVSPVDEQIRKNEDETGKLIKLRDALLPKLLSDEICLKDVGQFLRG